MSDAPTNIVKVKLKAVGNCKDPNDFRNDPTIKSTIDQSVRQAIALKEVEAQQDRSDLDSAGEPKPVPPIDCLPAAMANAIKEAAHIIQAPIEIALQSALGVASFSAQGLHNVEVFHGVKPLGVYLLVISESGSRKTATDSLMMTSVNQHQKTKYADYLKAQEIYEREYADWVEASKKKNQGLDGFPKPVAPRPPIFVLNDATIEAIVKSLKANSASIILTTTDAASILGGYSLKPENAGRTMAALSLLWDGQPLTQVRVKDAEAIYLDEARLSVAFMAQEGMADILIRSDLARTQGISARFLKDYPTSLAGTRTRIDDKQLPKPHVELFNNAISALLKKQRTDKHGNLQLTTLKPTNEARQMFNQFALETELEQADFGRYESLRADASKAPEQALRLAGIVATFEGANCIESSHMKAGISLASYYLEVLYWDFSRMSLTENQKVLVAVAEMFQKLELKKGQVTARMVRQFAPTILGVRNDKAKTERLLTSLVQSGFLTSYEGEKSTFYRIARV